MSPSERLRPFRWAISCLALLASACSSGPGDPVVWTRKAWQNAAASILRPGPGPVTADVASVERRGDNWVLSVFEGPTGRLLASRDVATPASRWSLPKVHALAPGTAAFWFAGEERRPTYWRWNMGSDRLEESSFSQSLVDGSIWDLVAIPGTGEVLLGVLKGGALRLHAQEGDGPGVVELEAFEDVVGLRALYLEAVSCEVTEGGGRWQLNLHAYSKDGYVAALAEIERSAAGWESAAVPDDPHEGPRFASMDGAIQESVAIVPYQIQPGELRGRDVEAFRLAGGVSEWPCFGGVCVPLYRGEMRSGDQVAGEVEMVSLPSLETKLVIPTSQGYPDITVVHVGYVGEEPGGILYWTCVEGKLAVRRASSLHD
ncbi:MAG: hypothetical protein ACI80K_002146 [Paracoccaceae bacterium]